jgi:hypothetical protein
VPHLLRHGTSVFKVISERHVILNYILNATLLAKEQSLPILTFEVRRPARGARTHDLPDAKLPQPNATTRLLQPVTKKYKILKSSFS